MATQSNIPNHIGYILDGNRRWAKQNGLPTYEGHLAGYNAARDVLIETFKAGVKYVSLYVFSTENWQRREDEVRGIMDIASKFFVKDLSVFIDNDICLKVLGSRDRIDPAILKAMDEAQDKTKNNKSGTVCLCFNYGGQMEIVDAIKKIVDSKIPASDVTEKVVEANLYEPDVPAIDIVVRTSGEKRISNFMLWRIAYSEFMFMKKFWPEMKASDVKAIIREYSRRTRRLGK